MDRLWPELASAMADAFFAMLYEPMRWQFTGGQIQETNCPLGKIGQSGNREKADDASNQPLTDDRHY